MINSSPPRRPTVSPLANAKLQPARLLHEQLVTRLVAFGVVQIFEVIEIDEK
jgi:hypothetical protein